jgi:hypothetical protein
MHALTGAAVIIVSRRAIAIAITITIAMVRTLSPGRDAP